MKYLKDHKVYIGDLLELQSFQGIYHFYIGQIRHVVNNNKSVFHSFSSGKLQIASPSPTDHILYE